jgi:glutaredoxin 2
MAATYKGILLNLKLLAYEDEKTPVKMIGKKALPILKLENGEYLSDSLDIIDYFQQLKPDPTLYPLNITRDIALAKFEQLREPWGKHIHKILSPYFVQSDEFSSEAKKCFQKDKEESLGQSFDDLREHSTELMIEMQELLKNTVEKEIGEKEFIFEKFSLADILICAHLKGLDDMPEWSFSPNLGMYMQRVRNITGV